jgi:hypothetical protein
MEREKGRNSSDTEKDKGSMKPDAGEQVKLYMEVK